MENRFCYRWTGLPEWDKGWRPPPQFYRDLQDGEFQKDDFAAYLEENAPIYYGGVTAMRKASKARLLEEWHRLRWYANNDHLLFRTHQNNVCPHFDGTSYYRRLVHEEEEE